MNLKKVLVKDCVCLSLKSDTKTGIIEEMIEHLFSVGKITNRQGAFDAIMAREKKMSTGLQHGIAVPHAKTDTVKGLVAAIAFRKEGVDFESLDGQPANIFVMTLSPLNRTGPHIQFLSEMSQLLNRSDLRQRLLAAQDVGQVLEILHSGQ